MGSHYHAGPVEVDCPSFFFSTIFALSSAIMLSSSGESSSTVGLGFWAGGRGWVGAGGWVISGLFKSLAFICYWICFLICSLSNTALFTFASCCPEISSWTLSGWSDTFLSLTKFSCSKGSPDDFVIFCLLSSPSLFLSFLCFFFLSRLSSRRLREFLERLRLLRRLSLLRSLSLSLLRERCLCFLFLCLSFLLLRLLVRLNSGYFFVSTGSSDGFGCRTSMFPTAFCYITGGRDWTCWATIALNSSCFA